MATISGSQSDGENRISLDSYKLRSTAFTKPVLVYCQNSANPAYHLYHPCPLCFEIRTTSLRWSWSRVARTRSADRTVSGSAFSATDDLSILVLWTCSGFFELFSNKTSENMNKLWLIARMKNLFIQNHNWFKSVLSTSPGHTFGWIFLTLKLKLLLLVLQTFSLEMRSTDFLVSPVDNVYP